MTQDTHASALRPELIQPGVELELEIDKLAMGGKGIGRAAGLVLFVERGLPGQKVRARVSERKKRHAEAELLEVLQRAPQQREAPCQHFADCGGCTWQHLDYAAQLEWKRRLVAESLQRIGGAGEVEVLPTMPSPQEFHYRNKMEFAFAGAGESLRLGLRRRGSHEVLPLETCLLPPQEVVQTLHVVREFCAASGLPAWDPETKEGFWRYLTVRSFKEGEDSSPTLLAQIITADVPMWDSAAQEVMNGAMARLEASGLRGVVHGVRRRPSQVAQADGVAHAVGEEFLDVVLQPGDLPREEAPMQYEVSANAFFQTNSEAAAELAGLVRRLAAVQPGDVVWDVYCGGGGPGLFLARDARLLVGFELGSDAVADARHNAAKNDLGNCVFRTGEVRRLLPAEREKPDVVLLDPPRNGLHEDTTQHLLERAPRRIVYVSCNPATQARDVGRLLQGYRLATVQPLDLFPQTHHVESVALLERR